MTDPAHSFAEPVPSVTTAGNNERPAMHGRALPEE